MRRIVKIDHGPIKLVLLALVMLTPFSAWAEDYPITVAGVQVTSDNATTGITGDNITGTVTFTPADNTTSPATPATLTLSDGASVGQIIYSGTSNLTIAFSGTCSITTEETSAIQYTGSESDRAKLTFSSTNGTLTINGESIGGFSDVDFGSLNLASIYAQGVYYDTDGFLMRGHGTTPSDLTITTETYYPIWIYDPSLSNTGYSHTQLRGESAITIGDGTVSFDGNHTITISNINFNYEGNTLIVVSPSMTELTVNLVGQSTATSGCTVLSLWDTTPLTFTTNANTPGSLTGYDIVSWNGSGNEQISYENGLRAFYDVENPNKETISTTGTYIKIGDTSFSETENVTFGEGTAYFNASSNTLTLTDATIGEQGAETGTDIQVLVDDLTIEISGTNTIYGNITYNGSNYQSSNIQINKASSAESASLTATNVNGFSGCTWGDGLYLSALDGQGATIDVHYEHYDGEGGLMESYYGGEIADVIFSTTPSNTIWVVGNTPNAEGVIQGTGIEGTVTYSNGVLTLNGATISTSETSPSPLIVCNGDLTVNLVGNNNTYFNGSYATYNFKNNSSTGELTIKGTGNLSSNYEYSVGDYIGFCDGFTKVNFEDDLGLFNLAGTKYVKTITGEAPVFYISDGVNNWTAANGLLLNATYHYKIDYVDTTIEGNGVEVDLPLDETNHNFSGATLKISDLAGPCTITSYAKMDGTIIGSKKAKLFGFTGTKLKVVYDGSETPESTPIVLSPAIEEDDGIEFQEGANISIVTVNSAGSLTPTKFGRENGSFGLTYTGDEHLWSTGKTIILNEDAIVIPVEVVPTAPTIELVEGEHLSSETVSITSTITGAVIKYKWNDGTTQTYTEAIPVENGTLTAWVEVNPEGTTIVSSEEVTAEYTVKTDIATLYVAPIENITYTGSAVTPTIVVKATKDAEASLVSGTDYTVSYKQGETSVAATDLINVATYTVVISGNGSYGGTKEIRFNITQAENSLTTTPAAVTELTYTGEAKDLITAGVAKFGDVLYKLGADGTYSKTIPTATDANTTGYTVYYKVEGTDNYAGIAEASIVVAIAKANVTITQAPTANTLTYTGAAQALVEAGTVSAGTMVYSKTINGTFTAAIPEETNAGTYTVYYKVDGNDNYNGIDASETNKVSVTINPATITGVTLLLEEPLVYSGEPQTVEIATVTAGTLVLTNENTDFAKVFDISGNSATERGTHTVTITAKENSNFTGSATADFSIKYRTASLDFAGQTFGTFYYPEENLELPETIKAYIISGVSGNSVTLTDLNYIPMGVPVLVEKIEGTATRPEANPETTSNMLKYASENASLNRSAGTLYVLYNGMFVRATNNTVAAQNVYLQVPVSTPNSARTLSIKGGDGTTAIESVNRIESSDTDRWYDMQGRRIERPTKTGIYLNNGKKVVIK